MLSDLKIQLQIPANKYQAPRSAQKKTLIRQRLVDEYLTTPSDYQYFFMEAQAGQGKTTTAVQFLSHLAIPYVWYQITPEDTDPLYFISALYEGINRSVQGFSNTRT